MIFHNVWNYIRQRISPDRVQAGGGEFSTAEMLDEIDRSARETGARLPGPRKFRKRLLPSVRHAMAYVSERLDEIPGPVVADPEQMHDHPILEAMFLNARELSGLLRSSQPLKRFFARTGTPEAVALLTVSWKEKTMLGTEADGDIIRRDVLQRAVYFEDFSISDPALDLRGARREAIHRAIVDLFDICLAKVSALRSWQNELETQQDLLEFKMRRPEDAGRSDKTPGVKGPDAASGEIAQVLSAIGRKLTEIAAELDAPEDYFNHLNGVLMHPEHHLKSRMVSLKTGRMGALLIAGSSRTDPVIELPQIERGEGRKSTALWVRIDRRTLDAL